MKLTHELINIAGHRPDHKLDLLGQVGQVFVRPASLIFGNTYDALTGKEKFYSTICKVTLILISTFLAPLTVVITTVGLGLLYLSKSHSRLVEVVKGIAAGSIHAVPKPTPLPAPPGQTSTPLKAAVLKPLPQTPEPTPVPDPLFVTPEKGSRGRSLLPVPAPAPSVSIPQSRVDGNFEAPPPLPASPLGSVAGTPQAGAGGAGREVAADIPNPNPPISFQNFRFFALQLNTFHTELVGCSDLQGTAKDRYEGLVKQAKGLLTNCTDRKCDYASMNGEIKSIAESLRFCRIKLKGQRAFEAVQKRLETIMNDSHPAAV